MAASGLVEPRCRWWNPGGARARLWLSGLAEASRVTTANAAWKNVALMTRLLVTLPTVPLPTSDALVHADADAGPPAELGGVTRARGGGIDPELRRGLGPPIPDKVPLGGAACND